MTLSVFKKSLCTLAIGFIFIQFSQWLLCLRCKVQEWPRVWRQSGLASSLILLSTLLSFAASAINIPPKDFSKLWIKSVSGKGWPVNIALLHELGSGLWLLPLLCWEPPHSCRFGHFNYPLIFLCVYDKPQSSVRNSGKIVCKNCWNVVYKIVIEIRENFLPAFCHIINNSIFSSLYKPLCPYL